MRILVGVDGSRTAQRAVTYVRRLVRDELVRGNHEVILVYAIRPPHATGFRYQNIDSDVYRIFEQKAENILEQTARIFDGVDVRLRLRHDVGQPAVVLTRFAEEEEVDLLVVGSRGLGGLKGMALGSVSQRVVQMAACPVLVIHGDEDAEETSETAVAELAAAADGDAADDERPDDASNTPIEKRPRCQRCGVPLTDENTTQETGYCDPCRSAVEGEIRRRGDQLRGS